MKYQKSRQHCRNGWASALTLGLFSLWMAPTIAAAPPVVRAKSYAPQEPLCYMDSFSGGRQNLDATCIIGKPKTKAVRPFDMTTDRDKDGVPDDVNDFFNRMEALGGGDPQAAGANMARMFGELADRSPLNAEQKSALKQVGQIYRDTLGSRPTTGPNGQLDRQYSKSFERIGKLMDSVEKSPFMQQLNEFSSRRSQNRFKQLEQTRNKSQPAPVKPVR